MSSPYPVNCISAGPLPLALPELTLIIEEDFTRQMIYPVAAEIRQCDVPGKSSPVLQKNF